jgi:hypothetical protein
LNTELINTLLTAGVVTEAQLERAAHYDSGSSLVEKFLTLGYGSEDDVYKVIQNKMGLPVVAAKILEDVDKKSLEIVPKAFIEKNHILPFHVDEASVHVAMFDPTQDTCLSELHFFANLKVLPYGALASDLTKALNKYYSLGLPEKFKYGTENMSANYKGPTPPPLKKESAAAAKMPPVPPLPPKPAGVNLPPLPTTASPKVMPDLPPLPAKEPVTIKIEEPKKEVIPQETQKPEPEPAKPEPQKIEPQKKEEPRKEAPAETVNNRTLGVDYDQEEPEFQDICQVFPQTTKATSPKDVDTAIIEQATNKDAVLNASINEVKKLSSRCIILFVKYDDLVSVVGAGSGIENNLSGFKLSLLEPSVFKNVRDSKKEFYGPMPGGAVEQAFIARFGNEKPQTVTIVPSMLDDEVFAVIYTEETPIVEEVKRVAVAMALAFDKLLS